MTAFLPLLYDALAVSLLLYHIYISSRRGLAATLANFVGCIVALSLSWALARQLAPMLFEACFRAGLVERVQTALTALPGGTDLAEGAAALLAALPAYLAGMVNIGGYDANELAALLAGYGTDTAGAVVDNIIAPAVNGMLSMVLFLLLYSLLSVVAHAITRLFYGVNRVPVIGFFNSVMGGMLGLAMGVISVYIVLVIVYFVLAFTGDSLSFLNRDLLESTFTCRLLARFEPFGLLTP